jgi:4-hydroxyacetophenone monooxygenase
VISAVGAFNQPRVPRIDGVAGFRGPAFHTARWPSVDLRDKRVAVVGNGASAMQVVPAIAPTVRSLTVFQRSPHWIAPFPKFHAEVPAPLRGLLRDVPLYHGWYRQRLAWTWNDRLHPTLQRDPQWPHPERSVNADNDRHRAYFTAYIERELADRPNLVRAVVPTYPPYGKRILLDNGWYRALRRPNVDLVTSPVTRLERGSVRVEAGTEHPADAVVFATGFNVVSFLSTIEVVGRGGRSLHDVWDGDDARAFLGLAVPGFPNFFILYGPNTQPGHGGSLISAVEAQLHYIVAALASSAGPVEVRREVFDEYNAKVDRAHERMVWTHPGMATYYRNTRGRVVVNTPFRIVDFWTMSRRDPTPDLVGAA